LFLELFGKGDVPGCASPIQIASFSTGMIRRSRGRIAAYRGGSQVQ